MKAPKTPTRPSMSALLSIQAADPDGHPTEPTAAKRRAFRKWATKTFGPEALTVYLTESWDTGRWE